MRRVAEIRYRSEATYSIWCDGVGQFWFSNHPTSPQALEPASRRWFPLTRRADAPFEIYPIQQCSRRRRA